LAGAVVALAVYLTLASLAVAIGISGLGEYLQVKTFAITAAVVLIFSLLVSLFLGGFVASRTPAGENPLGAALYGALGWGAMVALLLFFGSTLSLGVAPMLQPLMQQVSGAPVAAAQDTQAVAWWAFAALVLSLAAAVGGSVAGAGPELELRKIFVRR